MILTGVRDVIFNNMPSENAEVMFFHEEPIHWFGIGMQGGPEAVVDQFLENLREARKQPH